MATTPQTNSTLAQIAEVLRFEDDIVICGHVSPDGDCLGSQLSLASALKALGKNVTCVLAEDSPVSGSLAFMPGIGDMVPARDFEGPARVFVGLDVPVRGRIGDAAAILDRCATSVTIDHHASDTAMCEHVYVDPDSASASILVWEVVKMLVDEPPLESALCAYVGLATDTGGFRFRNSDARAFSAAAELVAFGVDPEEVAMRVFQNRTFASLQLESLAIERMELFADGQAVISWVGADDMARVGAMKSDAEPLVDVLRSLRGTRVACMLREQGGVVRGSLRSKDGTDVSALARELGGGGHRAAAGITLDLPLEQAVKTARQGIADLLGPTSKASA